MERDHGHSIPSSATQSSDLDPGSVSTSSLESVRARAELFRKLLDEVESGRLDIDSLTQRLQDVGATPDEAKDYVEQLQTDPRRQHATETSDNPQHASSSGNQDEPNLDPGQAADAVVWAQLRQKLSDITGERVSSASNQPVALEDLAKIFDLARPRPSVIPPDVLVGAPHLQEYLKSTQSASEGHLEQTWKLRQIYTTEKACEAIIDLMQRQPIPDPLPRSIWKEIVLDKYVDFEKLHAGMDRGYDHDDEPKDFGGGYSIVKKDHYRSKKPVQSESDWLRVARSWKQGVELLFPHRKSELTTYMEIIDELFRAAPRSPSVAIGVDVEVRDKYAKRPYRMDDRNQIQTSILTQMFRAAPSSSGLGKRRGSSPPVPGKKPYTICRNWNLGYCNDDECPYQRTHGICYECGGSHRAKDREDCLEKLKKRRRQSGQSKSSEDNQ
jgi:hypothetical protein